MRTEVVRRYQIAAVALTVMLLVGWGLVWKLGGLERLHERWIDMAFRWRGPIASSQPVLYVNRDALSSQHLGRLLFPRWAYAHVAEAALALGGAKVVFFDVTMGGLEGESGAIDWARWEAETAALAAVVQAYPQQVVMAGHYTDIDMRSSWLADDWPLPEMPGYPLYRGGVGGWGRVGLINRKVEEGGSLVMRAVPWGVHLNAEASAQYLGMGALPPGMEMRVPLPTAALAMHYADCEYVQYTVEEDELLVTGERAGVEFAERIPLRKGHLLDINWYSRWVSVKDEGGSGAPEVYLRDPYNPMVGMVYVLQRLDAAKAAAEAGDAAALEAELAWFRAHFEGRVVLVGPTDPLLQDLGLTPFGEGQVPRVAVHGNLVKMLADGRYIRHAPLWVGLLAMVLLSILSGSALATRGRPVLRNLVLVGCMWAGALVFGLQLFAVMGIYLPIVGPLGCAVSSGVALLGLRVSYEEWQKRRVQKLFGTYISKALVHQMIEGGEEPQLGGESLHITAFFSDVEGFSAIAEQMEPQALVALMNSYLSAMTTLLEQGNGTLDKTIGDAIVGIFGAPVKLADSARAALATAVEMQAEQQRLCERWRSEAVAYPEAVYSLRTRIGLHCGMAVVGNMGSHKRFSYTMMGDTVNLAARLETAGKQYGVNLLVSEAVMAEVGDAAERYLTRCVDCVRVVGRHEAVAIYEVLDLRTRVEAKDVECFGEYGEAMAHYCGRDWGAALAGFKRAAVLERRAAEAINPSAVMIARCEALLAGRIEVKDSWLLESK